MIVAIFFGALVIIIIAFLIFVARQPDEFSITRTEAISTPAAVPFALVNDLHQWQAWSPWEGLDPDLQRTYEGPAAGVGAIYEWVGRKSGAGRMTIDASEPSRLIGIALEFKKPFAAQNVVEFTFSPRGDHTVVAWTMTGHDKFGAKLFSCVCNRDKIVGTMFEQGLAKLKAVSEKNNS